VLDGKKAMLVALKHRKYASICWSNVAAEKARNRKGNINRWKKVKKKLQFSTLPLFLRQLP